MIKRFFMHVSVLMSMTIFIPSIQAGEPNSQYPDGIVYVVTDGSGTGGSWKNAMGDLNAAVKLASEQSLDVYVAAGTYKGDTTNVNAFIIEEGVNVYGGFAGTETSPSERNLKKNKTILTGQGKQRVLFQSTNFTNKTKSVWDGFVIQDGVSSSDNEKNGIGAYLKDYSALVNCEIKDNIALHDYSRGIGIYMENTVHSTLENCLIHHNGSGKNENGKYIGSVRGSAIFFNAGGQVVNSTIVDNTTVDGNTVELLIYDNVTFTNSIIVANRRIGQDGSIYPLSNFNLYGNPLHFVHCAVDGGTNGFSSFPISKSDLNADYSLTQYSSCVDAGIEISHFSDLDITGNKRTQGKRIDIGAIESSWTSTITPSKNNIIYVSEKGKKNGSGSSWEDATCMLQAAVNSALLTKADVYVAAGTYKGDTLDKNAFTMLSGVKVYGGFAGTEKSPSERNLKKNKSILTGQGKQRVLYQTGIFSDSAIAVWDGFVIQDGATRDDDEKFGAGVWLKDYSALVNCEIKENTLLHNSGKGVGVYIYDAEHSRLENCLIHHNGNGIGANGKYVSGRGTAIYAVGGNIINCTIVDNVSIDNSKAVEVEESRKFNLINSIICNNKNINVYEGSVNVGNLSISYPDKAVVRNCAIGDAYGHGNISIYPSELTSDYALNSYSSCVDAGFDIERLSKTDLYGNKRVQGKGIDIGAVESSVTCVIKPSKNNIIYVSAKGDADATGESWAKATSRLQSAINIAGRTHADVYVAAGTYYGDTLGQNAFTMIEGVNVYGGFAGTETSPSERDLKKNKTILSGQGKQRVLRQMSHFTDSTMTVWDGFVIQDGSTRPNEMSNGIGAWLMDYSALVNCEIKDNLAYKNIFGFGVYINDAPHSRLENCLIHHNGPALNTNNEFVCSGGGTAVGFSGSGNMINCTVTDNESYNTDAAVDIRNRGVVNIVNSIIVGNKNFTGSKSPKTPKNITVSGNSVLKSSHCTIDGTYSGEGNISINASDLNTDYSLKSTSSCIDAGMQVDLLDAIDTYGNKRVQGKSIDIGAIESSWSRVITPSANNIIYVSENGKETATGSSWEDATNLLQTAINVASRTGADVYVTAGTYKGDTASVYAFVMGEGVNVYGGFTGTETSPSERNLKLNKSVLTGQNKQHVLCQKTNFTDSTFSVWDGFVIRDGRTRSRDDNRGVGVWMKENSALINCEITNNTVLYSGNHGGGVYIDQAENSRIENCIFHHNYDYGGWLFGGYGCALFVERGGKMINCTVVDNISKSGSTMIQLGSDGMFEIANTIIYGNKNYELGSLISPQNISTYNKNRVKISHCAIESGDNRNLNLEEAPGTILLASTNNGKDTTLNYVRFINPIAQDYSLHSTSPCVNSGVDSVVSQKTDILSNNRIYQTVDMGAIEWDGNYVSMQTYGQTICNGTATKVEDFDKVADQFKWTLSSNEGVEGFVESGMDSIPSMTLVNNANDTLRLIYSVLPIIDGNEQGSFDYEFAVLPTRKIGNIVITNPKDSQVVDKVNIEFDWYNVNNAKSYTVSLADTSGNWTTIADGITQSYYKYHLDNFTSYKWAITASNECVSATSDTINFSVNDTSYILFNKEKVHLVTDFKAADSIEVHVEGNQLSDGIAFKWVGNDSTMFSYKTAGGWDKINGGTVRVVFHPTIEQSDYEAKLVAFSGKASDTLTVLGAIPNHYNFTIATQKKSYTTSDTVKLHGKVTDMFGNPVNV
ncbi:MAG: right-handed parallel beta-helix repeat-containing protein, partial [Paludibacteraceae bacterium]|nr:right-handed parallel beta-helix repeat-containing protein [Paludibacteraceae bacterium]